MAALPLSPTERPTLVLTEGNSCIIDINIVDESFKYLIIWAICLSFGLIYCFLGYRCLKMVLFACGFSYGSSALLLLHSVKPSLDSPLSQERIVGIRLGLGVLCGLLAMLIAEVGYILSGLQLAALLCIGLTTLIGQFCSFSLEWMIIGFLLVVVIPTVVFTLSWPRQYMIMYTSVLGAAAVMLCVDYADGTLTWPNQVRDVLLRSPVARLCWFDWAEFCLWPLLSVVGGLVQWRWTAKESPPKHGFHKKQQQKHVPKHRHFSQGGRRPHRKRRPPPLKRYAGDVLAPSYIQSLQERRMGTGSSCSSISSSVTHSTIDFDFETGSTAPLTASPTPLYVV